MKSWHKIKDTYFSFSKSDRIGIVVLLSLIIAVNAITHFLPDLIEPAENDSTIFDEFVKNYEANLKKLNEEEKNANNSKREKFKVDENKITTSLKSIPVRLFQFDPNNVSEKELIDLGFNKFQRGNLIKYREKGGLFFDADDLLKIYGVDSMFYNQLIPYINIKRDIETRIKPSNEYSVIDINLADSVILVKLKGIGPVLARRICRYRKLLGGFVDKGQLLEVYGISNDVYMEIEPLVTVGESKVQKIRLNFSNYTELVRHPYIDKAFATIILAMRRKTGPLTLNVLNESDEIDHEKLQKVEKYLSFE